MTLAEATDEDAREQARVAGGSASQHALVVAAVAPLADPEFRGRIRTRSSENVRNAIQARTGSALRAQTAPEGLNSEIAGLLVTSTGKVFVKGRMSIGYDDRERVASFPRGRQA